MRDRDCDEVYSFYVSRNGDEFIVQPDVIQDNDIFDQEFFRFEKKQFDSL